MLPSVTIPLGYSGGGSTGNPVHTSRGSASTPDGRHFDWNLQTTDGRTAKFSVDSKEFDLFKGALFFVTTQGGKTEVTQLNKDLSAVPPDMESCEAFLAKDPDVIEFLGAGGK